MKNHTFRVGDRVTPAAAKGVWTIAQIDRASNSALCTGATFGYWFDLSSLTLVKAARS